MKRVVCWNDELFAQDCLRCAGMGEYQHITTRYAIHDLITQIKHLPWHIKFNYKLIFCANSNSPSCSIHDAQIAKVNEMHSCIELAFTSRHSAPNIVWQT